MSFKYGYNFRPQLRKFERYISEDFLTSEYYGYSSIYATHKRGHTNINTESRKVHHPVMEQHSIDSIDKHLPIKRLVQADILCNYNNEMFDCFIALIFRIHFIFEYFMLSRLSKTSRGTITCSNQITYKLSITINFNSRKK